MASISVNQLAKFIASKSKTHQEIVTNLVNPPLYVVNYYTPAQNAITSFLNSGLLNDEILVHAIELLHEKIPRNDRQRTLIENNIYAINCFMNCIRHIEMPENCVCRQISKPIPKVVLNDVNISVAPNCVFNGYYRGEKITGGIKLYFSKDESLSNNSMHDYITVMLRLFLQNNFAEWGDIPVRFCQVIDVFHNQVYCVPQNHIRKLHEIEHACNEILLWWNHLTNQG